MTDVWSLNASHTDTAAHWLTNATESKLYALETIICYVNNYLLCYHKSTLRLFAWLKDPSKHVGFTKLSFGRLPTNVALNNMTS